MPNPTCTVEGCEKPARSGSATLCPMHYHRQYRHGSVEATAVLFPSVAPAARYKSTQRPDHPLAPPCGRLYVHRIVLFDEIGEGPHPCHWCGRPVNWSLVPHPDELQVDHLNAIKNDNRTENLVPACRNCNATRGSQRRADILRQAGWWSNHDTVAVLNTRVGRIGTGVDAAA